MVVTSHAVHKEIIDLLAASPGVVADLIVTTAPAPAGEWSVQEIFGHIRAADAIWRHRILLTLVHDGVTVPDVDERRLQEVQASAGLDIEHQLTAWSLGRDELVGVLRALTDDAWERACTHESAGPLTVLGCVMAIAAHELEHLSQMRATARQ